MNVLTDAFDHLFALQTLRAEYGDGATDSEEAVQTRSGFFFGTVAVQTDHGGKAGGNPRLTKGRRAGRSSFSAASSAIPQLALHLRGKYTEVRQGVFQ